MMRASISVALVTALLAPPPATPQQSAPTKLNLVIVEGEGAINNIRQRTAREPIVQVEDENRKPVAGAVVIFTLPESGAGGTFPGGLKTLQVTTDQRGRAVAKGLRPNNEAGKYQIRVEANYQGMTANAAITQSNAVITAAAAGISAKTIAIIAAVGGAAAVGGVVAATRGNGNGAPPPTVIAPGTPTVGGPR